MRYLRSCDTSQVLSPFPYSQKPDIGFLPDVRFLLYSYDVARSRPDDKQHEEGDVQPFRKRRRCPFSGLYIAFRRGDGNRRDISGDKRHERVASHCAGKVKPQKRTAGSRESASGTFQSGQPLYRADSETQPERQPHEKEKEQQRSECKNSGGHCSFSGSVTPC